MRKQIIRKFGGGFTTPDRMDRKPIPLRRTLDIEETNDWYNNDYQPEYQFTNENEHIVGKYSNIMFNFLKVAAIGFASLLALLYSQNFLSDQQIKKGGHSSSLDNSLYSEEIKKEHFKKYDEERQKYRDFLGYTQYKADYKYTHSRTEQNKRIENDVRNFLIKSYEEIEKELVNQQLVSL